MSAVNSFTHVITRGGGATLGLWGFPRQHLHFFLQLAFEIESVMRIFHDHLQLLELPQETLLRVHHCTVSTEVSLDLRLAENRVNKVGYFPFISGLPETVYKYGDGKRARLQRLRTEGLSTR